MTDPALSAPAPTTDEPGRPVPVAALRLLTSDGDHACVDDLCVPSGARDQLIAADDEPPLDGVEPAR